MTLPTRSEIEALHRKYAPSEEAFQSVFTHCCAVCAVCDVADQLMAHSDLSVDKELVRVGCLIHDLGVYKLWKEGVFDDANYICHGVLGEELLAVEGFPQHLCRFASHHTGVGITKEEIIRRGLPLPHQDFIAETEEEALVMYADKFHSKSEPPRFNSSESYAKHVARYGTEHVAKFNGMIAHFGLPDLTVLSKKYNNIVQ